MTLFEEELILRMPELDLDATHLVLSARERTGPGCGRRVLGSCVVGRGSCVGEDGRHHWLDMLRAAPDIVVRTHPLAALASFQNPAIQENPPAYQNILPGPSRQDSDLPTYHRYQNIGLLSSQSCPVMEIPGPTECQSPDEVLQDQCQEQDMPFSSDECQSSEIPTPDPCQSPELATDECQDTEEESMNDSHHSDLISSDQSHYSEISSSEQLQHSESSLQDQSEEACLSRPQSDPRLSDISTSSEVGEATSVEERNLQLTNESIYCNQPLIHQPKYDIPRIPSEPIYAKPDMNLKRSNISRKTSADRYANPSTASQHSYQSLDKPTEPIYETPDLSAQRIYDKVKIPSHHIYDKPDMASQHVYQNSNLLPQNIYQVPDLSVPRIYQDPNVSPPHIYESPSLSPEHIYQMPYESSLRRYQNIDMLRQGNQSEYQNIGVPCKRDQSLPRYENISTEHKRTSTYCPSEEVEPDESVRLRPHSSEPQHTDYQRIGSVQRDTSHTYETASESSEIYHDARSSTLSSND